MSAAATRPRVKIRRKNRRFMLRANHTTHQLGKPNAMLKRWRRWQIAEKHNFVVRESDSSGRVNELWRDIRPIEWTIIVRSAVAGRCFVTQIDPRLAMTIARIGRNL